MRKTLITRISNLKQYDTTNKTILWEDSDKKKWGSIYKNLQIDDNVIFIAHGGLLIGTINKINKDQGLLCTGIEDIKCKNDQLLQVNGIYPELISRVKANFKTFIHPKEVNITEVSKDIKNREFISFYIFKDILEYEKLKAGLKINDRIVLKDNDKKLENVKLHSNNGLISLPIDDNLQISVQGLTLIEIQKINNNSRKIKSNNIKRIQNIIDTIIKDGYYKFETFFSYHDALYNKQLYNNVIKEEISNVTKNVISSNQNIYNNESGTEMRSLNTILYGPPGTGKTYNTILRAAQISTGNFNINYENAKIEFKSQLEKSKDDPDKQIEFITFHQNYSYEDFIQGIRPDVESEGVLSFIKKQGVFKEISDRALTNLKLSSNVLSNKLSFKQVFDSFFGPLINGSVNDLSIKMKKVSYKITSLSNRSIYFTKHSGGTDHTLSIDTLKNMYIDENVGNQIGLRGYYEPLLKKLIEIGVNSKTSETSPKKNYVIIIDEINRANISRVFGELITLIEEDKRSGGDLPMKVTLPSGDTFMVPSNLYIIGTMNTADKSIALLDIALRRRFTFVGMYPNSDLVHPSVKNQFEVLNKRIIESGKGRDFQIGHSYFMGNEFNLVSTMNNKVIPLLMEYFMNDEVTVTDLLKSAGFSIEKDSWPLKIEEVNGNENS